MPALLTRMSRRSSLADAAAMDSGLVTSRCRALADPMELANASAAVTLMSAIHTKAPARTSSRTVDSPMPLAPPVTSAWRPSRRKARSSVEVVAAADGTGLVILNTPGNIGWILHECERNRLRCFAFHCAFYELFYLARASAMMRRYALAVSVIFSGWPSSIAARFTRSLPTPSARAPALMKLSAVSIVTPPVGMILSCGNGASSDFRYEAPPIAEQGKILTKSAPAFHAVMASVGVSEPGQETLP